MAKVRPAALFKGHQSFTIHCTRHETGLVSFFFHFCLSCIYPSQLKGLPLGLVVCTELQTRSVSGSLMTALKLDTNIIPLWCQYYLDGCSASEPRLGNVCMRVLGGVERGKTWVRAEEQGRKRGGRRDWETLLVTETVMAWICCCDALNVFHEHHMQKHNSASLELRQTG